MLYFLYGRKSLSVIFAAIKSWVVFARFFEHEVLCFLFEHESYELNESFYYFLFEHELNELNECFSFQMTIIDMIALLASKGFILLDELLRASS